MKYRIWEWAGKISKPPYADRQPTTLRPDGTYNTKIVWLDGGTMEITKGKMSVISVRVETHDGTDGGQDE